MEKISFRQLIDNDVEPVTKVENELGFLQFLSQECFLKVGWAQFVQKANFMV